MKINWLRISLGILAILAVSYVGLAHGALTIWEAPVYSTATYVWTDTPCGTTATKTIATTTIAQIDLNLAPGCHLIQATAKSATAVWNVYPAIQIVIARPGKPLNITVKGK
jgi:hypothetical protein